jgi:peptide/nickel transport system permease protein/oligopeptide transport system permease protein
MSEVNYTVNNTKRAKPQIGEISRIFKVMFGRKVVLFGTIIILILILTAIFAPIISPYAPNEINIGARLAQPSEAHLLGTDELGRDLISRIIYGSQISIIVGVVAVLIAGILGMGLGLIAGYFGGWLQTIIMRFIDALMAIPGLILMLAIAAVLGGGLKNVLISLGIAMMPGYCRLMCGQILALKERDFVMAADIIGASNIRIMLRHLLPNSFPPLIIMLTLSLGSSILAEASLSFLGIGIAPPTATWGTIVSVGYMYLLTNPLLSIAPGVAIFLVVLAFNLVGDGLRDALDPRLRGRI